MEVTGYGLLVLAICIIQPHGVPASHSLVKHHHLHDLCLAWTPGSPGAQPSGVVRPRASSLEGPTYSFLREMNSRLAGLAQMGTDMESAKAQIAAIHLNVGQLRMVCNPPCTVNDDGQPPWLLPIALLPAAARPAARLDISSRCSSLHESLCTGDVYFLQPRFFSTIEHACIDAGTMMQV